MAKAKHNLWKRRKNGPDKLIRSNKEWKKRSSMMKRKTKIQVEKVEGLQNMELTWTGIGLLVVQMFTTEPNLLPGMSTDPCDLNQGKDITFIKYDDIQSIKTHNYSKCDGGMVEFYTEGTNVSDSLGVEPITIRFYNKNDYNTFTNELIIKIKDNKIGK